MSFLTRYARDREIEQIRRELGAGGGLLCVHAETAQEAIDVTRLALVGLPAEWRVATVDLSRCATTHDVIVAMAHAVAIIHLGDPARLSAILDDTGGDRAELIDLAEAGGSQLLALLEGNRMEHSEALDVYGRALDALARLTAGSRQPVVLALLAADEMLVPERKSQHGMDPALLWTLRARLQHGVVPPRVVLAGGAATVDLVSDKNEAFAGWGKEIAIAPLSSERLQHAIKAAAALSGALDPVDRWLPGIIRLAEGSAAVAGDLLELLRCGTLAGIHDRPRNDGPDAAFLELIELNAVRIRQEVRALRALDPAALPIALAVAHGLPPYRAVRFSSYQLSVKTGDENHSTTQSLANRPRITSLNLTAPWYQTPAAPCGACVAPDSSRSVRDETGP